MLLTNITDQDLIEAIESEKDANKVNSKTEMVAAANKVSDVNTLAGIVAGLDDDATEEALDDAATRLIIWGALYSFGCFQSTVEGRFPLATLAEAEKNKDLISEFQVVPGTKRIIGLRKEDGKEYRKGNPNPKGAKEPSRKWASLDQMVKTNTRKACVLIKRAAKIANRRIKAETKGSEPEKAKAPANKTTKKSAPAAKAKKTSRKGPPKSKKAKAASNPV